MRKPVPTGLRASSAGPASVRSLPPYAPRLAENDHVGAGLLEAHVGRPLDAALAGLAMVLGRDGDGQLLVRDRDVCLLTRRGQREGRLHDRVERVHAVGVREQHDRAGERRLVAELEHACLRRLSC
jgi:hypothetical protein